MFYDIDKRIGKKVWVFEEENHILPELNQEKEWIVESLNEPDEKVHDYYFTLVNGEEKIEKPWYETVVVPSENEDELARISEYLHANGLYDDGMWHETILDANLVRISIEWGDWKHEHGWLDDLLGYLGYDLFGVAVTEENGSDCYSADHLYVHKSNPRHDFLFAVKKIFA